MIVFGIAIAIIYSGIVFMLHKLFEKEFRPNINPNKGLGRYLGPLTFYWQSVLLIGLGILFVLLLIAKWVDFLPIIS